MIHQRRCAGHGVTRSVHTIDFARMKAQSRLLVLAWSIALLALVAGCAAPSSSSGTGAGKQTPSLPNSAETATVMSSLANSQPVSMQVAWGNAAVRRLPTSLGNNRVFAFEDAATPDGVWLVGEDLPRTLNNTTLPCYTVLYNVRTGQVRRIHTMLHPQSQMLGASADDHWVVWSEGAKSPGFTDWVAFAYNRDTGNVTQIARAADLNGQAQDGPYPVPVVDHGQLLWAPGVGPAVSGNIPNTVLYREDLVTGARTTLATKVGYVTLSWPWALWGQYTSGSTVAHIVGLNLSTGQRIQLQSQIVWPALSGTSATYWDSATGDVYLLNDITKSADQPQLVMSPSTMEMSVDYATLNARVVTWNSLARDEALTYDRAEKRLVALPAPGGYGSGWAGGKLLMWETPLESQAQQEQDTKNGLLYFQTMNVIDTTTLPVLASK